MPYQLKVSKLVPIGEAAKALGVAAIALRRWEVQGRLVPERTPSGQPRYDLAKIRPELVHVNVDSRVTLAYARVSSHGQKDDLERQKEVLELFCTQQGWTFEVVADLGSGMSYHKKGLKRAIRGTKIIVVDRFYPSSKLCSDCGFHSAR